MIKYMLMGMRTVVSAMSQVHPSLEEAAQISGANWLRMLKDVTLPLIAASIVAGIFLAAPMSAIMSTVDAQLIQSSSIFVKDLYLASKPEAAKNEKRISRISSVITLILSALLILAALNPPDMIIWLNLFAFGGLEAAFLWVIVLGIYWDKANAAGAISSMVVGLSSYVLLTQFGIKLFGFNAIVPALVFGLIAFILGNQFGTKKQ